MTGKPRGRPKGENPVNWQVIQLRLEPDVALGVDELRRDHLNLPSRAEIVREIVTDAVERHRAKREKEGKP